MALNGFTVGAGAGLPSGGTVVANVNGTLPVIRVGIEPHTLVVAIRADLSIALATPAMTAFGAGIILHSGYDGRVQPYLGGGVGLSSMPLRVAPLLTGYALAGYRIMLTSSLSAVIEGQVSLGAMGMVPNIAIGLAYTFGGN